MIVPVPPVISRTVSVPYVLGFIDKPTCEYDDTSAVAYLIYITPDPPFPPLPPSLPLAPPPEPVFVVP